MANRANEVRILRTEWNIGNCLTPQWGTVCTWYALGALCLGPVFCGCGSRPARIHAIGIDPSSLSDQLIAEFDSDASGALSSLELEKLPPIHQSRSAYEIDGNGEISAAELEARFKHIFAPDVGVLPASCRVTRNGRPIVNAVVSFVPPKCLVGVLPSASGVTDDNGTAGLCLAPEDMPENLRNTRAAVMRPGIYIVQVRHPVLQIPGQYNTQTKLGKEVFSEVLNGPPLPIELKF